MNNHVKTDVLVIGSGIAGSIAALTLAAAGREVTLITAGDSLFTGNTRLAQGGIVFHALQDNPRKLEQDILTAGWNLNLLRAVRYLCNKGPRILQETLIDTYHIPFAQKSADSWYLTREGGHSLARILCAADHTGQTIIERLVEHIEKTPNIRVLTQRTAIDLLTTHHHAQHMDFKFSLQNQCVGAYVFNSQMEKVETILADFTVLATGGVGQVYLHTTNSRGSIGSGLSMASRAGAKIMNAEYMQFHPTALYEGSSKADRRFLISEAVRGEGARLINSAGEAFMPRHDQRADLAPRDIVARAITEELLKSGDDCVYLDAANYVEADLKKRFPTIYEKCLEIGVDMARDPIPVVPVAHFFCGGVLVDNRGRTTLERLYAAGECSCTGLHGANRLASTSLLEGLVWGHSTALDIIKRTGNKSRLSRKLQSAIPDWVSLGEVKNDDPALIAQDWATIRNTMWNYVGITRTTARLSRAFSEMRNLSKNIQDFYKQTVISKPIIDLFHGCQAAYLITQAALRNKKSQGCHYRVD
ncbi:L-aspartate oxidase [Desulfovibrio aminophilus]|uniref:L-aspartate oxidase n=1 Tax=Desulfovibrio aminophilus TaxID=81425 RepID=UPI0033923EAA